MLNKKMVNVIHKINEFKTAWRENASMRFLLWVIVSFFIWNVIYYEFLIDSVVSVMLTEHLADTTVFFLRFFGYTTWRVETSIYLEHIQAVNIGNACNGLDFFGVFSCFVFTFPAPLKHKVWLFVAGLACIHILNIVRLILLPIIYISSPDTFDFNHKYTFVIVIYGVLFFLWFSWAKKYRSPDYA